MIRKLIFAATLLAGSCSYASEVNPTKIYIHNQLPFGRAVEIEWSNAQGRTQKKVVDAGANPIPLGDYAKIKLDAPFLIKSSGEWVGAGVVPFKTRLEDLVIRWRGLDPGQGSDLKVDISLGAPAGLSDWRLTLSVQPDIFKEKEEEKVAGRPSAPLQVFGRLKAHQAILDRLRPEMISQLKWDDIVRESIATHIPVLTTLQQWYPGFKKAAKSLDQVTGEDIFRYILALPKNYTRNDVTSTYRRLALEWHPDRTKYADKTKAGEVFGLIDHAYKGLIKALDDEQAKQAARDAELDVALGEFEFMGEKPKASA